MFRSVTIAAAAIGAVLTLAGTPAQADGWHRGGWHGEGGWGRERFEHGRPYVVGPVYAPPPVYYAPPPVYYAPPPVYYAPPPVYYAPPSLGVALNVPGVSLGVSVPLH